MGNLIRLTGLWKAISLAGQEYLTGDLSPTARLVILPNTSKGSIKEPDFIAFLAPVGHQESQATQKMDKQEEGPVQLQWWQK